MDSSTGDLFFFFFWEGDSQKFVNTKKMEGNYYFFISQEVINKTKKVKDRGKLYFFSFANIFFYYILHFGNIV